jgi:hypothetical protein
MLLEGRIRSPGVIVPERLGAMDGIPEAVLTALSTRGIRYTETVAVGA